MSPNNLIQLTMKITNLKKAEAHLVGMEVPKEQYGNVGIFVQDVLESLGYIINRGAGCDTFIGDTGIEVKTRNIHATSAQTIATMLPKDIIRTPYEKSPVYEKFQQQFRVHFDDYTHRIVRARMYDFRDRKYQKFIKAGYESARIKFAEFVDCTSNNYITPVYSQYPSYVCGKNQRCYFEQTQKDVNSYAFRLRSELMESLENLHDSSFASLFEIAEI
jgi:hypothetical protein